MKAKKSSKRIVWILVIILLAVILCGLVLLMLQQSEAGNTEPPASTTTAPTQTTTEPTSVPTTVPPTETTVPETTVPPTTEPEPTEPPFLSYNPMTGEGLYEVSENRPYAIVFNNIKAAMPQYGVGEADILCEISVEGGGSITRCLGIYYDLNDVEAFGSIRSARPYLVSLAQSFDAIFIHAGRSDECQTYLNNTDWDHLDGVHGDGSYFYRDQDRINAGYSREHTMFIKPEKIIKGAKARKLTLTRDGGVSYGWEFIEGSAASEGETAEEVKVWFNQGSSTSKYIKNTTFEFNAEDGLYYASQHGSAYTDAGSGKQLSFRNLLILRAKTVNQGDKAGHLTITLTGSGTGYYACDGKIVEIKWSRESTSDPFTFELEDGTTLDLSVGKTYMGITTKKGVVEYE